MKLKTLVLALLLAVPGISQEDTKWTKTEITLEVAYQVALFIDWKQTSNFHNTVRVDENGTIHSISERNWMLGGSNPKQSTINIACFVSSLGHFLISYAMGHDRIIWQSATLMIELVAVNNNYRAGVKIRW